VNVSVVIPVHNGARYLAEAIASVHAQTTPPCELVVVDDGSTDGSGELAVSLGAVCVRQDQAGIGAARNAGVRRARGDAIAFLDADDLWSSDKLERQVTRLGEETAVDGAFGWAQQFVSPDLPAEERAQLRCPTEPQPGIHAGALLVRRSAFERTGGFDEAISVGDFLDWYARATDLGLTFATLEGVVLRRRLHGTNTMRKLQHERAGYVRVLKAALDRRRQVAP
jgi:glycosyltransferase involved in cell wall biosynthesis